MGHRNYVRSVTICTVWDSNTGELHGGQIKVPVGMWVTSVVWSSDSSKLYAAAVCVVVFPTVSFGMYTVFSSAGDRFVHVLEGRAAAL